MRRARPVDHHRLRRLRALRDSLRRLSSDVDAEYIALQAGRDAPTRQQRTPNDWEVPHIVALMSELFPAEATHGD